MTIRLSGAQVTQVREALARFKEHDATGQSWYDRGGEGVHLPVETLVEDILTIVVPEGVKS